MLLHGCTPPHADSSTCLCTCPPLCRHDCCASLRAGGADSHAQPCFLVLPAWPRTVVQVCRRGRRMFLHPQNTLVWLSACLCAGQWGCAPMRPCELPHVCLPELQGAGRQLEEAWLQAGGAEGQQGTGFWGETASRWDYCCQHCEAVILALGIYTACSQRDAC